MIEPRAAEAVRRGTPADALACAAILNEPIDGRGWMPRIHAAPEVVALNREHVFREGFREVRRTAGDNEEGRPDVLLRWERGRHE